MFSSICYVLRSFPEPSETFITEEAASVQKHGAKVHILYLNEGQTAVVHPIAQRFIDGQQTTQLRQSSHWKNLLSLLKLFFRQPARTLKTLCRAMKSEYRWVYLQTLPYALWCKGQNFDYLHAHFADMNSVFAKTLSAWTGIPFGITTHGYDLFFDPLPVPTVTRLLQQANALVTISRFNRSHMAKKFSQSADRVVVIRSGIELNQFPFLSRKDFKRDGVLHLLNVGRLVKVKAQDILLKAMHNLRGRGISFRLEIIGAGPQQNELLQLRDALGLGDCVDFLGAQPQAVVQQRLAAADIFVLSSRSEGLPVACLEAMASGTPLLATRITGIPELITDGVDGRLVEADDPIALADAIAALHDHPHVLEPMRLRARQRVEEEFEREACTRQLIARWQTAIAQGVR